VQSCVVAEQQAGQSCSAFHTFVAASAIAAYLHMHLICTKLRLQWACSACKCWLLNLAFDYKKCNNKITALPIAVAAADQVSALQPVDVVDHDPLQLAFNCSDHRTAAMALDCMPHQLKPCAVRSLLLTAVARQHAAVWHLLLKQSHVVQHIDAATYAAVIELLLLHNSFNYVTVVLRAYPDLPEAAQPDADAVALLLLAAMSLSS
jgi:hypothetical protein